MSQLRIKENRKTEKIAGIASNQHVKDTGMESTTGANEMKDD